MKINVLGAGTWGIVVSTYLSKNNHDVLVYHRNSKTSEVLIKSYIHPNIPSHNIPRAIKFTPFPKNWAKLFFYLIKHQFLVSYAISRIIGVSDFYNTKNADRLENILCLFVSNNNFGVIVQGYLDDFLISS